MKKSTRVPSGRLNRIGQLGGLAAKIAGSAISKSAGQLLNAQKPSLQSTVLTADNALSITQKLAQMRGAAMKFGQMLSMDAGEFLPQEWEPILAQLRQNADSMPKEQLLAMLKQHWHEQWMEEFTYFSFEPIAAASIGQVHKAQLKDGTMLAIKVQYPGVADSISSDVNNLGRILKFSGMLPKELDIDHLLDDAKVQLAKEADYNQEVEYLSAYARAVANDDRFIVPSAHNPLCNRHILAMEFVSGMPLEQISSQGQAVIDNVCNALLELTLFELFESGLMQSDPNFANYFYQHDTGKIVLLDFGACCEISASTKQAYLEMANAMQKQDKSAIYSAFITLGLVRESMPEEVKAIITEAAYTASECLQADVYNIKQQALVKRLYQQTQGLMRNKNAVASPSFDTALVNRKISGIILLANRLGANLRIREALTHYLTSV